MTTTAIGRKQALRDQATWQQARARARDLWPDDRLDELVARTAAEIEAFTSGQRAAVAWSGGKDSLALERVAALAGVTECVLAISQLEYPAFLQWVTDYMPDGLTIVNTGQDVRWLAQHPEMLFPQGAMGARWFTIVNHRGQARYYRQNRLDMLLLGRRRLDGNFVGKGGEKLYVNSQGICRYSPLADWTHEAVFALLDRERVVLPPCYGWPRGFQVGTGSWPARQWTSSADQGWEEVWSIDPDVVRRAAADGLAQARGWLARTGR